MSENKSVHESTVQMNQTELLTISDLFAKVFFFLQIKGLVHPKMKISPCFTHPQSNLGVYDFLLSDESNSYIKKYSGSSKHYNGSRRVFLFNSPKVVK